jgi:hypothetical protein
LSPGAAKGGSCYLLGYTTKRYWSVTGILAGDVFREPVESQKSMHSHPGSTLIDNQAKSTPGHSAAVGDTVREGSARAGGYADQYFRGRFFAGKMGERGASSVSKRFNSGHLDLKRAEFSPSPRFSSLERPQVTGSFDLKGESRCSENRSAAVWGSDARRRSGRHLGSSLEELHLAPASCDVGTPRTARTTDLAFPPTDSKW